MTDKAQKQIFGLIGRFNHTPEFFHAVEQCRDQGFVRWDTFTPFPVHGLDGAMGLSRSKVPSFTLIGGLAGFATGTLITWYMNAFDYPLIVGGKPFWSPVFPFPVMYELTILCAAFGTLLGMFLMNLLPRHNHPVFEMEDFHVSTDDTFFILIEKADPQFDREKTTAFLKEIGAEQVDEVEA